MARYWVGGGPSDYTISTGDTVTITTPNGDLDGKTAVVVGGMEVTFWNAETGGTQYTDLLDSDGLPATSVWSSDTTDGRSLGQIPRVQYPDDLLGAWASANGGPRAWMAADVGPLAAATALQAQATAEDLSEIVGNPSLPFNPSWAMDAITVGGNTYRRYNLTGRPVTLRAVCASVGGSTPSGGPIVVSVRVNGTEVFNAGTRPSIAAGARESGIATSFDVTAIPAGGYMTAEVISAPASTPGSKLVVEALAY